MDYLEKIFQVPFALWPRSAPEGFARVIAELSQDQVGGHPELSTEPELDETGKTVQQAGEEPEPIRDVGTPLDVDPTPKRKRAKVRPERLKTWTPLPPSVRPRRKSTPTCSGSRTPSRSS